MQFDMMYSFVTHSNSDTRVIDSSHFKKIENQIRNLIFYIRILLHNSIKFLFNSNSLHKIRRKFWAKLSNPCNCILISSIGTSIQAFTVSKLADTFLIFRKKFWPILSAAFDIFCRYFVPSPWGSFVLHRWSWRPFQTRFLISQTKYWQPSCGRSPVHQLLTFSSVPTFSDRVHVLGIPK